MDDEDGVFMIRPFFLKNISDIRDIKRFFSHIGYIGNIEKNSSIFRFQYSELVSYNKLKIYNKVHT